MKLCSALPIMVALISLAACQEKAGDVPNYKAMETFVASHPVGEDSTNGLK